MESAAALAKELSNWTEVADFYRKACELYIVCGRTQLASDALAKAARALEDDVPDEAIQLYIEAGSILEEDEKEQMAFDLYRAATCVYIKLEKCCNFPLEMGISSCNYQLLSPILRGKLQHPYTCRAPFKQGLLCIPSVHLKLSSLTLQILLPCHLAYLSAIIVYLYARDFKQAEKCYNDCAQIDVFLGNDHGRCASKLLSAYSEGNIEEIKRVAQSSTISNLDHVIIRLARKLPTGEVSAQKTDAAEEEEEPLDEDDLT
ncbi:gamma-soluble NSF attachment protein [Fagus crenata]